MQPSRAFYAGLLLVACELAGCEVAAAQERITSVPDNRRTVRLSGHVHPLAQPQFDQGALNPSTDVAMITLLLKPSENQQAALDRLLADQQDRSTPDFHRWLTPEQFADRFGSSAGDVAKIRVWLESQGLRINDAARGRGWITFSGTAERVSGAFHTELHRYTVDGESHFANATAPAVPEAFESLIGGITGLNDFGPARVQPRNLVRPQFDANGAIHYIAPDDIATIYDVQPLYNAGTDGTGQAIAILGQSDVNLSDIRSFRQQFGLPPNDPKLVLIGPDPGKNGSEPEGDLDLEWSGALARNASIFYVYAQNVFTAAQYAVDQNIAPVMSTSYSYCEHEVVPAYRSVVQQASAQGITWVSSSGDAGAAGCDRNSYVSEATRGLSANFPASIPEITAVGGTIFAEGSGNYWSPNNTAASASARSYIPEKAWNDTAVLNQLWSTGGGASGYFSKPAWQQGPGVPVDGARDVPDIALAASFVHDGYLIVSERNLLVAGGTSVGTPEFAGIVALLNQALSPGSLTPGRLGNINPMLYRLAQTTSDVFHDITAGDNIVPCAPGSPDCVTGSFGYSAGPGYDQATGLGSVDVNNLVAEWAAAASSTTTTLTATPNSVGFYGASVQLTATVATAGKGGTSTGTVAFVSNDINLGTVNLSGGSASITVSSGQLGLGSDTVTAVYSGDGNFASSSGLASVTVTKPAGAAVAAFATPNPVYQQNPDSGGYTWFYQIALTEQAGVAATITSFTTNGSPLSVTGFFGTATIPANGSVTTSIRSKNLNPPASQVFAAAGTDANGQSWSQQVTVQFLAPVLLGPAITLASTPGTVLQNPSADPACQWSQQLTVQELTGFPTELTKFTESGIDLTSQIQQIFGTTRLAAYGSLAGAVCFTGIRAPAVQAYELDGSTDRGGAAVATLSASFGAPASGAATMAASPSSVTIQTGAASSGSATVNLNLGGSATAWTVSLLPSNRATAWLAVSPLSGTGSAQLTVQVSAAGLENGVYRATLVIQAVNALPQYIDVPITFVAGASSSIEIGAVSNGASFKSSFAPGMVMSVFGSQLAPPGTAQSASLLPLPLSLAGVSASVNGVTAPLYYVSPGQLNIQIPYETGAGPAVVGVNNNGQVASFPFQVATTAPGIFVGGNNQLAPSSSGKAGDTLLLFLTGDGDLKPTLPTGETPSPATAAPNLPQPRQPVTLTVGGLAAKIQFIGVPYGLAGVTQINFTIPANIAPGPQQVVVNVGGVQSQSALLTVTQ